MWSMGAGPSVAYVLSMLHQLILDSPVTPGVSCIMTSRKAVRTERWDCRVNTWPGVSPSRPWGGYELSISGLHSIGVSKSLSKLRAHAALAWGRENAHSSLRVRLSQLPKLVIGARSVGVLVLKGRKGNVSDQLRWENSFSPH